MDLFSGTSRRLIGFAIAFLSVMAVSPASASAQQIFDVQLGTPTHFFSEGGPPFFTSEVTDSWTPVASIANYDVAQSAQIVLTFPEAIALAEDAALEVTCKWEDGAGGNPSFDATLAFQFVNDSSSFAPSDALARLFTGVGLDVFTRVVGVVPANMTATAVVLNIGAFPRTGFADRAGDCRIRLGDFNAPATDPGPLWRPIVCGDDVIEGPEECDNTPCCSPTTCTFETVGTTCGDGAVECSGADTCDGAGTCLENHLALGAACGDQGIDCLVDDSCSGAGACVDNGFAAAGTSCGDSITNECNAADTCDASGSCQDNHASDGTACDTDTFCLAGDECVSGNCVEGDQPACAGDEKCLESAAMCTLTCGDGVVDTGEECDTGASNSDTTPDACRDACAFAVCGDGVTDTGEQCDDGADGSETCDPTCQLVLVANGGCSTGTGTPAVPGAALLLVFALWMVRRRGVRATQTKRNS